ncbi:unnamed protein product, partial [Schistosoma curassoni]|uniref:Reverse transcriptase domain-containing protein n=1 Tax=Schistosoma curassoni TaxID=6186 RepID=A0A183JEX6_9TREM
MMLLVLCPKILEEINNAENGAPLSPEHQKKKQFMDEVRKALASHGHGSSASKPALLEAALLAAVNLCKASTYININDRNNILFILVHSVYADLQNLLFNPNKPYLRNNQNLAETESLLTEFFVAYFRITPHNKNLLKVCLQTTSPAIYHTVLVSGLYRIITQSRLAWWPDVSPFYSKSTEIRSMFLETLNRVNHHPPIRITQASSIDSSRLQNSTNRPFYGFRKDRSCTDQIVTLWIIIDQSVEWNSSLYIKFIDYEKAFDSVDRRILWILLRYYGVHEKIVNIIRNSYDGLQCKVVHGGQLTDTFQTSTSEGKHGIQWAACMHPDDLDFTDDLALLSQIHEQIQMKTASVAEASPSSLTFRDKMNLKNKDKTEDNLMSKYNLLLNMVRLLNANPLLMLYSPQTRSSSDAQKATFDLMNGLMSLIQQSIMSDLAQEAMDALLCLHQPANIRLWNLHSPAQAFWEI